MIDSHRREINYLRVSITDRCNLRCEYCMPKEGVSVLGHEDILRYEEILRVVKASMKIGIVKVRVTGGEPLIRRGVVEFIRELCSLGLKDAGLTTNGILLEDFAGPLFNAGLRRINISLDSLDPEKYGKITRGGDISRVIRGIRTAHDAGFFPIKINFVVLKGFNEDEILPFVRLTLDKPFQVRFIELMPVGRNARLNEARYLSNDSVMDTISREYTMHPLDARGAADGPAYLFKIDGAAGEIGFIHSGSGHICERCNRLRLTADGHLRACLLREGETDIKPALRAGCSDAELEKMIRTAIDRKPAGRPCIEKKPSIKKCGKEMSAIGG